MVINTIKNPTIHIVPSGSDKTFCGKKDTLLNTSLGVACTCKACTKVAEDLLADKKVK